jgi:hypothetical protein
MLPISALLRWPWREAMPSAPIRPNREPAWLCVLRGGAHAATCERAAGMQAGQTQHGLKILQLT